MDGRRSCIESLNEEDAPRSLPRASRAGIGRIFIAFVLLAVCLPLGTERAAAAVITAETPGGSLKLEMLREHYRTAQLKEESKRLERESHLAGFFIKRMRKIEKRYLDQGDLENALVINKERNRFARERQLNPEHRLQTPPELNNAQKIYLQELDKIRAEYEREMGRLEKTYQEALPKVEGDRVENWVSDRSEGGPTVKDPNREKKSDPAPQISLGNPVKGGINPLKIAVKEVKLSVRRQNISRYKTVRNATYAYAVEITNAGRDTVGDLVVEYRMFMQNEADEGYGKSPSEESQSGKQKLNGDMPYNHSREINTKSFEIDEVRYKSRISKRNYVDRLLGIMIRVMDKEGNVVAEHRSQDAGMEHRSWEDK